MELKISTCNGYVEGMTENHARAWKGIPFASEYTGQSRFRSAKPCGKWDFVLKTVSFAPVAPQFLKIIEGGTPNTPPCEDSLGINVWAPEQTVTKKPVMVWIYGGAFVSGDSSFDMYNGSRLAAQENILVVTFNYRINVLGFLDFSSLIPEAESNVGLRDQVLALKWIYENIEAFGGDMENITIFGQSAGGHSVTTLLAVPSARKYFARAIAMSSYPLSVNTKKQAAAYATRFLEIMGIEPKDAQKLFSIPAIDFIEPARILENEASSRCNFDFAFVPTVDGDFLPMTPLAAAATPKEKIIPLIMGVVADEGSMFSHESVPYMPTTDDTIAKFLGQNKDWITMGLDSLYKVYPSSKRKFKMGGDILFGVPCMIFADAYSRSAPVWMYRFSYYPQMLKLFKAYSLHGSDVPFAFGNLHCRAAKLALMLTLIKTVPEQIKKEFSHDLAEFAAKGTASWEPYSENKKISKEFNRHSSTCISKLAPFEEAFKKTVFFQKRMGRTD